MTDWDALLADVGFAVVAADDAAAWDAALVDDLDLGMALDAVALGLRLSDAASLDDVDLGANLDDVLEPTDADRAGDDLAVVDGALADLVDASGNDAETTSVDGAAIDDGATDAVDLGDDSALTMTGDVVGFEADPDAFAAVVSHLGGVETHAAWMPPDADASDDRGELDTDDLDDDLGGDWHIPR